MSKINNIFERIENLNKTELEMVTSKLLQMLKNANGVALGASEEIEHCRKCSSHHIIKFGKDAKGKQRYKCKSCGATFTELSYSVISKTQQPFEVWEKYIELLLQGVSLAKSAEICGISVRTAFIWRHKILDALQHDQDNRCLAGVVEMDETYFSINYKGNHLQAPFKEKRKLGNGFENDMPRPSYKRGTDNTAHIGSMTAVMCAYERGGQAYAEVLGKGFLPTSAYEHAFEERIMPETIVISDTSPHIKKYFKDVDNVELIQVKAHKNRYKRNSPPEIKGAFHIQSINNMHSRIRSFMRKYNGVATKYLNHYIGFFIWLENYKKVKDVDFNKEIKDCIKLANTYITRKDIFNLPKMPSFADIAV